MLPAPMPGRFRTTLGLALSLLVAGCAQRAVRTLSEAPPPAPAASVADPRYLKAHLASGDVIVLSDWTSTDGEIRGTGRRLDANREVVEQGPLRVPVDSVLIFETNEVRGSPVSRGLAIVTGASAALTAFCLTNTKACFGSCPTFYAPTGDGEALLAEGFSSSISPVLEATDVDALAGAQPSDGRLEVRMTNEALETHVVRHADLLAVPKGPGGAWQTGDGQFVTGGAPRAPTACTADDGDCLAALRAADGHERLTPADSTDLAARETLDLWFDVPPGDRHGLVLTSRQSLLATFLFYQMLAYMGDDVGQWFAHLESEVRAAEARGETLPLGLMDRLGGIEVLVEDGDGAWVMAGTVDEHGPLATDRHLVRLPLLPPGPAHVRLRLARGAWRLDAAEIVALGAPAEPVRIRPSLVRRDGAEDGAALRQLLEPESALVTLPGDAYTLVYDLPSGTDADALFLESRGYYLEWMRDEWLPETDPEAMLRLIADPGGALRQLAPRYKALEPSMEAAFWNSRYAR